MSPPTLKTVVINLLESELPLFNDLSFVVLGYLQSCFINSGNHQNKLNLATKEQVGLTGSASVLT